RRDEEGGPRSGCRRREPPLEPHGHAERPGGLGERVAGEGHAPEVGVVVEDLVDADGDVLPRLEPARVERREIPAWRIGNVGREGLVVVGVDILQAGREAQLVEVDGWRLREAIELGARVARELERKVEYRRRP